LGSTLTIPVGYREVALTCIALGDGSPTPTLQWYKVTAFGLEQAHTRSWVTDYSLVSQLLFENGFQPRDMGEYVCSVQNQTARTLQLATLRIEVGEKITHIPPCPMYGDTFEIRVLDTRCDRWNELEKHLANLQFVRSLASILAHHCESCPATDVSTDNIMLSEELRCNTGAASFRGTLVNLLSPHDAFCAINNWRLLGSAIVIDNELHFIDRYCDLEIDSLYAPGCAENLRFNILIYGAASGSAFFFFLFVCCILLICTCCTR
jgi:hypothetical protein